MPTDHTPADADFATRGIPLAALIEAVAEPEVVEVRQGDRLNLAYYAIGYARSALADQIQERGVACRERHAAYVAVLTCADTTYAWLVAEAAHRAEPSTPA